VAWLAAKSQSPVVPVAIGGTEQAMGIGVRFPRPRTVRLVWGEPLAPPEADEQGRLRRADLARHSEDLREVLQKRLDAVQQELGNPVWDPDGPE